MSARTLEGLLSVTLAGAVVAAATDRGSEVLAHLGAITGLPMAANCSRPSPPGVRRPGGALAVPAALGRAAARTPSWRDRGAAHRGRRAVPAVRCTGGGARHPGHCLPGPGGPAGPGDRVG